MVFRRLMILVKKSNCLYGFRMLDDWTLQATPAPSRPTNLENHRAKRKAKRSPEKQQNKPTKTATTLQKKN